MPDSQNKKQRFNSYLEQIFEAEGPEGVIEGLSFLFGNFVITIDGIVIAASQSFIDLVGYGRSELYGMSALELITPDERSEMAARFRAGDTSRYELKLLARSGDIKYALVSPLEFHVKGERYRLAEFIDITDRKIAQKQLEELNQKLSVLSFTDELTGLSNRRYFNETLEREWNRAQRYNSRISLVMFDIDFFKPYNDFYGHLQGDECLKLVADAIGAVIKRGIDLVVRYGGEEFVLLLPETDMTQAIRLAEECRIAVTHLAIPHEQSDVSRVVTVSAGIASMIPAADQDPLSLLDAADKMLYRAKEKGRNRVEHA